MKGESKFHNDFFSYLLSQQLKTAITDAQKEKVSNQELSREEILSLIDLAIDTGDKKWFMELSEKYKALAV